MRNATPHYAKTKPETVSINACLLEYNLSPYAPNPRPIEIIMRELSPEHFRDPELREIFRILQRDYKIGNMYCMGWLKDFLPKRLWRRVTADADLRPWNEKTLRFVINRLKKGAA